ncbi:MAG: hypothetical protein H0T42_07895 [Deltaproteobacteria bacterium]|nr:hypothetical protein [Deltaproteobacteria bacterium]
MTVTIYGRTYLDAEVMIPLPALAEGKGKVDVEVHAQFGGFACNAARAVGARLPAGTIHAVTVCSELDLPRLRARLPAAVISAPILDGSDPTAWPPISVIINPAGECRLLRGRGDHDAALWRLDLVTPRARSAALHILGRVPLPFVGELLAQRTPSVRIAWCGGDAISPGLERELDLMCVNVIEAQRLLGTTEASPRILAEALAVRAVRPGAVRLVTGRSSAPSVAAVREGSEVRCHEGVVPAPLAPAQIKRLKGVGDVFAARFLIEACIDEAGHPRVDLAVKAALAVASDAATKFITAREAP